MFVRARVAKATMARRAKAKVIRVPRTSQVGAKIPKARVAKAAKARKARASRPVNLCCPIACAPKSNKSSAMEEEGAMVVRMRGKLAHMHVACHRNSAASHQGAESAKDHLPNSATKSFIDSSVRSAVESEAGLPPKATSLESAYTMQLSRAERGRRAPQQRCKWTLPHLLQVVKGL